MFRKTDISVSLMRRGLKEQSLKFQSYDLFGGKYVLVCSAGIAYGCAALDYTPEAFRRLIDINATGTFLTIRLQPSELLKHFRDSDQGSKLHRNMIARNLGASIIFIASKSAHGVDYPYTHVTYSTAKAGVLPMTRLLASELVRHGIRVDSISPGFMNTRLSAYNKETAQLFPAWVERSPMGRIGEPADGIIGPVVLLASDAGSFMTGADIRVDVCHPTSLLASIKSC